MKEMKEILYALKDLGETTSVSLDRISAMIEAGVLPEPDRIRGARRMYSEETFLKVVKQLKMKEPLYNVCDIVEESGVTEYRFSAMIKAGLLPSPDRTKGVRLRYSEELFHKVIKELKKPLLTKKDMAERIGIEHQTLMTAVSDGRLPAPTIVVKKRAYYQEEDIPNIKRAWETSPSPKPCKNLLHYKKRREAGYFSISDIAKFCNCSISTLAHHTKLGSIEKPTHTLNGYNGLYYRKREKNSIVRFIEKRREDFPWMDIAEEYSKGKPRKPRKK